MGFDFPNSPAQDEVFTPGEASYSWNGYAWRMTNKVAYLEPDIDAVSPEWAYYDETPTVQVTGTQFHPTSIAVLKTVPPENQVTTYVSDTELSAVFILDTPAATVAGAIPISVETGILKSPLPFPYFTNVKNPTFYAASPMTPVTATAGSAAFELTVNLQIYNSGSNGEPSTVILWDGLEIPSTMGTANVKAMITPDAVPGTHEVLIATGRLVTTDPPQIFTFT